MSSDAKEVVHQGWLWKSPPAKRIFRQKRWSRQWFVLKCGTYPDQYVLEYFRESSRRSKRSINLDECEQICGPLNVEDRQHRYAFHLRTPNRTYYLAANNEVEMNQWIKALCQVSGLKMMDDEQGEETNGVVYVKAGTKTSPPLALPGPSNTGNSSGAYIPISECVTGKPIQYKLPSHTITSGTATAASGLYCNINYNEAAMQQHSKPKPSLSSIPSQSSVSGTTDNAMAITPPKVDRNLKPQVRKANESNAVSDLSPSTPASMPVPKKASQDKFPGPEIDRSRKPPDGHSKFWNPPGQSISKISARSSTLPKSSRRKSGSLNSPDVRRTGGCYPYVEDEAEELTGVYMEIDCNPTGVTEVRSQLESIKKNAIRDAEDTVEYHDIDLARTNALKELRQYREKQLQTNVRRHFT